MNSRYLIYRSAKSRDFLCVCSARDAEDAIRALED